ncbi:MAG TPA: ribosome maturation factor RimM [Blastocatellia bacterium]|nr:ribosome maturation factor RimM [Blastocatellia bacterium]
MTKRSAVRSNMEAADVIVIARIVKARGIKGEVACDIETDFPERFQSMESALIRRKDGSVFEAKVEDTWFHKGRVILKFAGYDSMTAAEGLAGGLILIPESEAAPLEEGEFHEFDVIGAAVVTASAEPLGLVTRIMHTGGTDLLVVERSDKSELLIPFADDICIEVDPDRRQIKIDPPAGLLDL